MITKIRNFLKGTIGQGMIEFILLVSLIAIGGMAGLKAFQQQMENTHTEFIETMDGLQTEIGTVPTLPGSN